MEEIKPANLIVFKTDFQENITIPIPGYLTPPQIAKAYNIPDSTGAGIKVGIISLGGGFLQSDLDSSMADMGLPPVTINKILVDGATGTYGINAGYDQENTLDIYCVASMVPEATINIYIPPTSFLGWYNAFTQAVADNCDVITCSWAVGEDVGAGDFLETPFTDAAFKGITILAGAGDTGSAPGNDPVEGVYYPASSDRVIAVGGTHLTLNLDDSRNSETVENNINDPGFGSDWGSGGGISSIIDRPSWQDGLTYKTYNSSTHITSGPLSLTMRGIPDISAPMNGYVLYYDGAIISLGGTSASTPVMAGMIARFKALTGKSKSSAQYNSLFYANPDSFYDITSGDNATEISDGYSATVGWDAVTGLGSPDGTTLCNLLNGPPQNIPTPASSTIYNFANDGITLQSNPVDFTPGDAIRPIPAEDQVEVYYGGRLLRKTGIFVQDTTVSYDSPMTVFTTATVATAFDLPINTKELGVAYITTDTNHVWVYTGSKEFDAISGYVYRGLNYLPPEFSINTSTQELTLNIPEALESHHPVRIDIIKREFSVSSEWNDIDPMDSNKTLSIMESTSTQARFLQARPAELPDNYYYGGNQGLTDNSGFEITIGGEPLGGL
jgi:subtilase family serine protease